MDPRTSPREVGGSRTLLVAMMALQQHVTERGESLRSVARRPADLYADGNAYRPSEGAQIWSLCAAAGLGCSQPLIVRRCSASPMALSDTTDVSSCAGR